MAIRQVNKRDNEIIEEDDSKKTKKNKASIKKKKVQENKDDIDLPIISIKDLEGKFLHVKVGNDSDPRWRDAEFSNAEISKVENNFLDLLEINKINCIVLVTHNAVNISLVESKNK